MIRQAKFIQASCCKHGKVALYLLNKNRNAFAVTSMDFKIFMALCNNVITEHEQGGFNCDDTHDHH